MVFILAQRFAAFRARRVRASLGSVVLVAAAIGVFLASWTVLVDSPTSDQLLDTPLYEAYGDALRAGDVPYQNYLIEYPPAALVAFVVPSLTARPEDFRSYNRSFQRWMAVCGVAMLLCAFAAFRRLGASAKRLTWGLQLMAVSPILVGPLVLSRFDLWPAALCVAALALLLAGCCRACLAVLAIAVAAKLYAIVCLPLFVIFIARNAGRRIAAFATATFAVVFAAIFIPFALVAPAGFDHIFIFQLGRPLQIESLGAALLVAAHLVGSLPLSIHTDHNSVNLLGLLPSMVGRISSLVQVGAIVWIQVRFARGSASAERLVVAVAAAVTVFIAFGKVLSPQYMIWLVPLVPLVRGRRGIAASGLLAAALALTHAWFPANYGEYVVGLQPLESAEVLTRDLVLVALAVLLIDSLRETDVAGMTRHDTAGRPKGAVAASWFRRLNG